MNSNRIDLNLLRVFDVILKTRSITVAAATLGLTQSSVSNALGRLRDALGDPLFVRTSEGMIPTPLAEEIARPIQESISRIHRTLECKPGFDPQRADRTFTLFMTEVGQMFTMPRLFRLLAQEAPHVRLHTEQVPPFRMRESAMESGDVDLAVGYFQEFQGPFHRQKLFTESFACACRIGHPIADAPTPDRFLQAEFIAYVPTGSGHAAMEAAINTAYEQQGAQRAIRVKVSHFMGLWTLVAESDLLVVLPRSMAKVLAGMAPLQVIESPIPLPTFEITQHWHERFHHHPANKWLRSRIAFLLGGGIETA
ncbi:LysR family transcriptional regulator [Bradyrhizobium jicamae]|uniref:LysR family transcriptional regulator n=1 Tax=Bradyrhizobium jicamae TaxID=280332 RepID=UPI001BAA0A9C|nr:LysR family transcriptional regulator [Bradyrhizobium jicamae]MBR0754346.1 LysR family transcriptional regulator [Bradyrhizobium jicamae]